jgi:hypothetical protein
MTEPSPVQKRGKEVLAQLSNGTLILLATCLLLCYNLRVEEKV